MEPFLRVGVITATHGLKGEVKVFPTTDDAKRFLDLKHVLLDTGKEQMSLEVSGVRFFKNQVILKFKEWNNISEAEPYKGKDLLVERADAVALAENENFIVDLIGMEVRTDEGQVLGVLTDVLQTGANDVYIVETKEKQEVLLPAIPACILRADVEEKQMLVHIPEGLLE